MLRSLLTSIHYIKELISELISQENNITAVHDIKDEHKIEQYTEEDGQIDMVNIRLFNSYSKRPGK